MSEKEDSDFEVFLTVSEYKKYQGLQKELNQAKQLHKKQLQASQQKTKQLESSITAVKKELTVSNGNVQKISLECLNMKRQRLELDEKILALQINCEKLKKESLETLEQSTVDKIGNQKKTLEVKTQCESFEKKNKELEADLAEVTEAYKQLQIKAQSQRKDAKTKEQSLKKQMEQEKDKLKITIQENSQLKVKLDKAKESFQKLSQKKNEIEQFSVKLKADLSDSKYDNEQIKQQLNLLKAQLKTSISQMQETELELKNKSEQFNRERKDRSAQIELLKKQRQSAIYLVKEKEAIIHNFEESLDARTKTISELQYLSREREFKELKLMEDLRISSSQIKKLNDKIAILEMSVKNVVPTESKFKYSSRILKLLQKYNEDSNFKDLQTSIDSLMVLEEQYEKIIEDQRKSIDSLKEQNRTILQQSQKQKLKQQKLEEQILSSSVLIEDLVKETGKSDSKTDIQLMLAKEQIERLVNKNRELIRLSQQSEKMIRHEMNELRMECKKLDNKCNELKTFEGIVSNPQYYMDYYVSILKSKFKQVAPGDDARLVNENIEEFITKIRKRKMNVPYQPFGPRMPPVLK